MVQLLRCNCLGISCGFTGFCSDNSSRMCLVGDRGCGIGRRAYRQKLHTTLSIRRLTDFVGERNLDGNWQNQQESKCLDRTGEAYDEGFLEQ